MQIYALDTQKRLIHASQASRTCFYACPECGSPLRLRGGDLRRLHFYHSGSTQCRHRGKSLTHLQIQQILQNRFAPETLLLEHHFPQIQRVADVVWPAQKVIFEVQVSPISAAEVQMRNQDYAQLGYSVVWILHDSQFNRSRISPAEIHLRSSSHYFTNINAFGKGFFYDQYALTRFKRRTQRSRRLPIRINHPLWVNPKQLARHFPFERKKWRLSFEGDLFHRPYAWEKTKKPFSWRTLLYPFRLVHHLLLEKTTY